MGIGRGSGSPVGIGSRCTWGFAAGNTGTGNYAETRYGNIASIESNTNSRGNSNTPSPALPANATATTTPKIINTNEARITLLFLLLRIALIASPFMLAGAPNHGAAYWAISSAMVRSAWTSRASRTTTRACNWSSLWRIKGTCRSRLPTRLSSAAMPLFTSRKDD